MSELILDKTWLLGLILIILHPSISVVIYRLKFFSVWLKGFTEKVNDFVPNNFLKHFSKEGIVIATKENNFTRVNEEIRVSEVRLIGADGEQVGVVETSKALEIADQVELDLVEIAPDAKPPVCRIVDYGKFRYDKEKKAKEARKRQKNVQMKGIRIAGANISDHDLEYRVSHIREFIEKGNRVKVSVRFRGRQMAYQEKGRQLLGTLVEKTGDIAVVDQEPRMEGREMSLILRPA